MCLAVSSLKGTKRFPFKKAFTKRMTSKKSAIKMGGERKIHRDVTHEENHENLKQWMSPLGFKHIISHPRLFSAISFFFNLLIESYNFITHKKVKRTNKKSSKPQVLLTRLHFFFQKKKKVSTKFRLKYLFFPFKVYLRHASCKE